MTSKELMMKLSRQLPEVFLAEDVVFATGALAASTAREANWTRECFAEVMLEMFDAANEPADPATTEQLGVWDEVIGNGVGREW